MSTNAASTALAKWKVSALAVLVVMANVIGNCFLSVGVKAGQFAGWSSAARSILSPALLTGVLLLIMWLFLRMALLSTGPMSVLLPVTAGLGYVVTGGIGQFWFAERVSMTYDYGLLLILAGVYLVGSSASSRDSKS